MTSSGGPACGDFSAASRSPLSETLAEDPHAYLKCFIIPPPVTPASGATMQPDRRTIAFPVPSLPAPSRAAFAGPSTRDLRSPSSPVMSKWEVLPSSRASGGQQSRHNRTFPVDAVPLWRITATDARPALTDRNWQIISARRTTSAQNRRRSRASGEHAVTNLCRLNRVHVVFVEEL
jgi:hypothetical protein